MRGFGYGHKPFFSIIFSLWACTATLAQGLEETLALADALHRQGNYESAVKLYRRVAFFGNDSVRAELFPRIASNYRSIGRYPECVFFYGLAANTASNDSLFNEYIFARALCNILMGHLDFALQDIYSFRDQGSMHFTRKYHFYLGVVSLMRNETAQSEQHFLHATRDQAQREGVLEAFREVNPDSPSPRRARALSMLIPGLGQLYAGDELSAANSFVLNAGLLTLLVAISIHHTLLDGLLSVGPWFQRYYAGGISRAEAIALRKREAKQNELLDKVIAVFQGGVTDPHGP